MDTWVHNYIEDLCETDGGTDLLRHMNYRFGARCDIANVSKELDALVNDTKSMMNVLGTLTEALNTAEEYGWVWPVRDMYVDDSPYVGDGVWFERLEPKVRAFVTAYRQSATFMTRTGQRSQYVDHASLDSRSGLTEHQRRKRREQARLRRERRRAREEHDERQRVQRDADVARMQELTEELEQLRKKQARVS